MEEKSKGRVAVEFFTSSSLFQVFTFLVRGNFNTENCFHRKFLTKFSSHYNEYHIRLGYKG